MRGLGCALVLAVVMTSSSPATALDMSCRKNYRGVVERDPAFLTDRFPAGRRPTSDVTCGNASLKGPIVVGDADKFARFLREHHPFLLSVSLESPGGNVFEAMKI